MFYFMLLFFSTVAIVNAYSVGVVLILKLLMMRSHFLVVLLLIEGTMIIIYNNLTHLITTKFASGSLVLFMFMVIMVTGASVGLAMVAMVTRSTSKESDLVLMK